MIRRLPMFGFETWHPVYRQHVTIDAAAVNRAAALRSPRRFAERENRRLRREAPRVHLRLIRRPQLWTIRFVPAAQHPSEQRS